MWDGHKGWCLATPKAIVQAGHNGRESKLNKCTGNAGAAGAGGGDPICKIQKSTGFGQTKEKAHKASLAKNGKHIFTAKGCNAVGTTYLDRSCTKIVGRGWSCTARYRCCKK